MSLELFLLLAGIALIVGGFFVPGIISAIMFIVGGAFLGFLSCELYVITSLWNP